VNILVDTSVWSAALRRDMSENAGQIRRLKIALEGGDAVFTTGLILQELLQGFSAPKSRERILEAFANLPLIVPERKDYIDAAALKIRLRQKGVQAGTIDVLLAQLCLRHQLSILTLDRDFNHIARFVPLSILVS
jgi:predicted nucleic acid-binding protein